MVFHRMLRRKFNQVTRITYFVHHGVAHVGTSTTANAFVLQAFSNINAGGADLHTQTAIDAGTQIHSGEIGFFRARTARLSALCIVSDDQGVFVKHGALKARIGAHVFANLLAHETRIAIGCKAIKENPKNFPGRHIP